MSNASRCNMTVCYLDETQQITKVITQPPGTTVERAIQASGILSTLNAQLTELTIAIYGQKQPLNAVVEDGDRLELLRPVNPNAQQRARQLKQEQRQAK